MSAPATKTASQCLFDTLLDAAYVAPQRPRAPPMSEAEKVQAIKAYIAAEKAKPEYILEQKRWKKQMKKDKKALEREGEPDEE